VCCAERTVRTSTGKGNVIHALVQRHLTFAKGGWDGLHLHGRWVAMIEGKKLMINTWLPKTEKVNFYENSLLKFKKMITQEEKFPQMLEMTTLTDMSLHLEQLQ
jgi:hypothetical protein